MSTTRRQDVALAQGWAQHCDADRSTRIVRASIVSRPTRSRWSLRCGPVQR